MGSVSRLSCCLILLALALCNVVLAQSGDQEDGADHQQHNLLTEQEADLLHSMHQIIGQKRPWTLAHLKEESPRAPGSGSEDSKPALEVLNPAEALKGSPGSLRMGRGFPAQKLEEMLNIAEEKFKHSGIYSRSRSYDGSIPQAMPGMLKEARTKLRRDFLTWEPKEHTWRLNFKRLEADFFDAAWHEGLVEYHPKQVGLSSGGEHRVINRDREFLQGLGRAWFEAGLPTNSPLSELPPISGKMTAERRADLWRKNVQEANNRQSRGKREIYEWLRLQTYRPKSLGERDMRLWEERRRLLCAPQPSIRRISRRKALEKCFSDRKTHWYEPYWTPEQLEIP